MTHSDPFNSQKMLISVNSMQRDKFTKPQGQFQYFANVGLKINLKFGGLNHKLNSELPVIKEGKTMVVGYDVIHPTNLNVTKDEFPSQVGMVASVDSDLGQWPAISWNQKGGQEMLDTTLTEAFKSRLRRWQAVNKQQLPENILFFRDGVSEGQYSQVLTAELPLIRAACQNIYGSSKPQPKLTVVVSVKRHHVRFYPTAEAGRSSSGNTKSGTVVDRGVTLARYWDFFLTAHHALQGKKLRGRACRLPKANIENRNLAAGALYCYSRRNL